MAHQEIEILTSVDDDNGRLKCHLSILHTSANVSYSNSTPSRNALILGEAKDDVAGHLEGCVQGGLSREEHAKLNWGQTCARSSGALWNDGNGGGEARG